MAGTSAAQTITYVEIHAAHDIKAGKIKSVIEPRSPIRFGVRRSSS
jgi:hypothetical protein